VKPKNAKAQSKRSLEMQLKFESPGYLTDVKLGLNASGLLTQLLGIITNS